MMASTASSSAGVCSSRGAGSADSGQKSRQMEVARPPVPEKPPVAAKPRPKLAPAPAPKPATPNSIKSSSPSSSASHSSSAGQNHHKDKSPSSHTVQNGSVKNIEVPPSSSCNAEHQKGKPREPLTLNIEKPKSPSSVVPPPLPTSPPPISRRSPLSPSTSLSLPASFRGKTFNPAELASSLTQSTSGPLSPTSPSSPTPSSPIRHVSPPRKTPPPVRAKPKPPGSVASSEKLASTTDNDVQDTETKTSPSKSASSISKPIPHTQAQEVPAPSKPAPLSSKPTVFPPQRTPPSRPAPPLQRPAKPPSRPAPPLVKSASDTKPVVPSPAPAVQGETDGADTEAQGEKKKAAPPPLPKNPPRGGVPRKPRSSNVKRTPTSEKKLSGDSTESNSAQTADSKPTAKGKDSAGPQSTSQSRDIDIDSEHPDIGTPKSSSVLSDSSSSKNNLFSGDSVERRVSPAARSRRTSGEVSEGLENSGKTPPRPRPRTRLSIPLPEGVDGTSPAGVGADDQKPASAREDDSVHAGLQGKSDNDPKDHNQNTRSNEQKGELEYVEVYRGDLEDSANSHSKGDSETTSQPHKQSPRLAHVSGKAASSAKESIPHQKSGGYENRNTVGGVNSHTNLDESKGDLAESTSVRSSIVSDATELASEEPEATCGMLKEIEELLKNKLGDIDLGTEVRDSTDSELDTPRSDSTRQGGKDIRSDSFCSNRTNDSPSSSPVRPPRPKRQASISKNVGSLESLTSAGYSSSTECLAQSSPAGNTSVSGSGKKVGPPKPKRTFQTRTSRSRSDVTGMRPSVGDSEESTESEKTKQDEGKPYLPPRSESLRRSDSTNSCVNSSPPPLPPRNKPRSSSVKDFERSESELLRMSAGLQASSDSSMSSSPRDLQTNTTASDAKGSMESQSVASPSVSSPSTQPRSSGSTSPTKRPVKPRPARKAPPPPPGPPKRSATFSPGDKIDAESGQSSSSGSQDPPLSPRSPRSPMVKKSASMLHKPSVVEEDHYHEIRDENVAAAAGTSQDKEGTPPPALPPRSFRSSSIETSDRDEALNTTSETTHVAGTLKISTPQTDSEETHKGGKKSTAISRKHSNTDEHKQRERSLIQKVAQGLGFGKSEKKKPRTLEVVIVPDSGRSLDSDISVSEPTSPTDERRKSSVVDTECVDAELHAESTGTSTDDIHNKTSSSAEDAGQETKLDDESDVHHLSGTQSGRPVSSISQQSSSSGHDAEQAEFGPHAMDEIVSSGSDTEPEEDKEEIYAQRKAKKVFFIAKEIKTSEDTFVDVLRLLNLDFRIHISAATEKAGHPVIPSETLNKILDFLPQLQNFNEDLLKDLTERIDNWETNPRIADIFVKKGPFLKLYSSYIRNFENAVAILEDATKKHAAFATALKEFEMSSRCAKLAIKHYMLKPIQRIPQYKLLLQDYIKHLIPETPEHKATVTALNIVSEVADHANDSMRHGDNVQKLLEIQRSLIGQFEVIQPGRELLKQGELQKVSRKEMQPRMFYLFSDVLLYTTPVTTGYKINNILPLTGMKVVSPKLDDYKFEFNIISVQRSFTLCASTWEEKEQWVTALQSALEENAKKHHTFEAMKHHGPQMSLLDKDFVLGHKAPLWVPDARVTMCMLCLVEFTMTWRRHHCRSCGRIICSQCSDNKAPLRYLKYKQARVCDDCFDKLKEDYTNKYMSRDARRTRSVISQSEEESSTSISEGASEDMSEGKIQEEKGESTHESSGLGLNSLLARFQKIRGSNRDKRKANNFRPSVLKEVKANDEGSDMSGYLRIYRSRKWKRLWFVVKANVMYTYKASEDMAAIESMPLLGFEVTRLNSWFEGAEPDLLFELKHQNSQPLTTKKVGNTETTHVIPGTEKTTQRLIFRTDSAPATTKWVTVLREASLT